MKIHNHQEPEFDSIIFVYHNLAANKESKTNEFRFVYDLYARQYKDFLNETKNA